jgi:cellulose synthase/poly-beta-1,6-N-acetylglucosamine synthase-like glycosyltransferase
MDPFPVHLLVVLILMNRYCVGPLLRRLLGSRFDETRDDWEPTVAFVVPLFNEGRGITTTVASLLEQDYPPGKLSVTVVDDCSTDDSYEWACRAAAAHPSCVTVLRAPVNQGKRAGINLAVSRTQAEVVVSVDSDVVVDRRAVRELVRRFASPRIAAVGGRTYVANRNDNLLTRMVEVKFHYSQEWLKDLERACRSVVCLSGCLTAYRREVVAALEPVLARRNIAGVPIKYGEDRYLTQQILKAGYQTVFTADAFCFTAAPTTLAGYFSQQLRWRRSNIVDYAGGFSHVWRLNPVLAIHFFSLFALLIVYPIALVRALESHRFFPSMQLHLEIVVAFGLYYRWRVRKLPKAERVGSLAFLPLTLLMPITYALLTPLALFTLDSGSWETRGHEAEATAEPVAEPVGVETITGQHVLVPAVASEPVRARARSQAQLPAA